jgi:hypothetical protein
MEGNNQIPETIQTQDTGTSVETPQVTTHDATANASGTPGKEGATPQQLVDIDKLEKFLMAGKEWTRKDLMQSILMQSDYTRKTQEISQERKFYDNLSADLEALKRDPALVDQFKKIYPEKFHAYLKTIGINDSLQRENAQRNGLDPEAQARLDRIEGRFREQDEKVLNQHLDSLSKKFGEKYSFADENEVLAKAEVLLARKEQAGEKDPQISDAEWEKLWEGAHKRIEAKATQRFNAQYEKQKRANMEGRDIAAGGGTPGPTPNGIKTVKDAEEAMIRILEQQQANR